MDPIMFLIAIVLSWLILIIVSNVRWVEVKNPQIGFFFALWRTKRFNRVIDRIASLSKHGWQLLFDVGIVFGVFLMIIAFLLFLVNVPLLLLNGLGNRSGGTPSQGGSAPTGIAIAPIIPGITISFDSLPYFIVAILIGAAIHELAHGVAARADGVKLKSTGIFVFFVFLGAFVEPEEESFMQASKRTRLRIIAAGAFSNIILAVLFLGILLQPVVFFTTVSPFYSTSPDGVVITKVVSNTPAHDAGLRAGMAFNRIDYISANGSINGTAFIKNVTEFRNFTRSTLLPNMTLTIHFIKHDPVTLKTTVRPDVSVTEIGKPGTGFIGIATFDYYPPRLNFLPNDGVYQILLIFVYTGALSLMLGLLNLLPVSILDGHKFLKFLLEGNSWAERNQVVPIIERLTLILFIANLFLSFVIFGWNPI